MHEKGSLASADSKASCSYVISTASAQTSEEEADQTDPLISFETKMAKEDSADVQVSVTVRTTKGRKC